MALFSGRRMYHHYQTAGEQTGASFGSRRTAKSVKKNTERKRRDHFQKYVFFLLRLSAALVIDLDRFWLKKWGGNRRRVKREKEGKVIQANCCWKRRTQLDYLHYFIAFVSPHAAHFVALIKNAVSAAHKEWMEQRIPVYCLQKKQWERKMKIVHCATSSLAKQKLLNGPELNRM